MKIQFYEVTDDGPKDTPLFMELSTKGCAMFVGSEEYIAQAIKDANIEYKLFSINPMAFSVWVQREVEHRLMFYLRPGGLISRIPEEDRPTREQIESWSWRIEDLETVTRNVQVILNSQMSKDVFVRKDPFGRKSSSNMFDMADYCSVLLLARKIREADNDLEKVDLKKIPLIRDGNLHSMPEDVCEEFDDMFGKVVLVLEEVDKDSDEFFKNLALGEIDFVGDVVNTPEFTQAMGNFLMKKYRLTKGYSMDEAYAEAAENLSKLKDEMLKFVGTLRMNCFESLGKEATERGIPLTHASRLLHPKVRKISREGVMVETALDVSAYKELVEGKTTESDATFDPSFG